MRHRVYGKHLSRNKDERSRLFKSLVSELFLHGSIQTSQAKAKAIKGLVDKVINLAREKSTQPQVQSFLTDKNLRERLIKEIIPKLVSRTSGYTSQVRIGPRLGDQTMMVRMSLIGAEELKVIKKEEVKKEVPAHRAKSKKSISEEKVRDGRSGRKTTSKTRGKVRSSKNKK